MEAFQAFLATRSEPSWVSICAAPRSACIRSRLATAESRRVETGRHPWLSSQQIRLSAPMSPPPSHAPRLAAGHACLTADAGFAGAVLHVDGRAVHASLAPELAAKGVLFGELGELLRTHGDVLVRT